MSVLKGKSYTKGKYTFSLECDVPDWNLWVYCNDEPLMVNGDPDKQVCKWLGDGKEPNKGHLYKFMDKFVRDEEYRNEYINGKRRQKEE